ncbi:hypothetical protein [Desulfosporosinus sp.]|uniref:hypothetical protein n=1 Tax=Desulfosporosinus sp. TaxID=157907 RepID=UPI00342D0179
MLKCPYCNASLIRTVHEGRWVSWICATYMQKRKSVCRGMRISDKNFQEITKDTQITEAVIVEEISNKSPKKR